MNFNSSILTDCEQALVLLCAHDLDRGAAHRYHRFCPRDLSPYAHLCLIYHVGSLTNYSFSLLKRKAQQIRIDTGDERWKSQMEIKMQTFLATITKSIYRPILLLTLEPMCLNLCIFSAILLGILYLFFGAFQLIFDQVYGFTLWQRGCSFLGLLVGMVIAIFTDPFWRWNYTRLERASAAVSEPVKYQPEWRLPPGMLFYSEL